MPHEVTQVNIAPAQTGVWASVDITPYAGPHAGNVSGVILYVVNIDTVLARGFGVRMNGSTDVNIADIWQENSVYFYMGVDQDELLRVYIEHSNVQVWLVGLYTKDEATFFTNAIDKSIGVPSSWQTVSIAAEVGTDQPLVAFLRIGSDIYSQAQSGVRAVGSTATDTMLLAFNHGVVVKVDVNKEFQVYLANANFPIEFLGYQTYGANMLTTKQDVSTATIDAWEVVQYSPPAPTKRITGVYFQLTNNATAFQRYGAHRRYGDTFDQVNKLDKGTWGWSGIDSQFRGEQQINNSELDLFVLGYTESSPPTALPFSGRSIHGGAQSFNGGLL